MRYPWFCHVYKWKTSNLSTCVQDFRESWSFHEPREKFTNILGGKSLPMLVWFKEVIQTSYQNPLSMRNNCHVDVIEYDSFNTRPFTADAFFSSFSYFKICSKGEAVSWSTRHLGRVFERNFGHREAGICRNLDEAIKILGGLPGGCPCGGCWNFV